MLCDATSTAVKMCCVLRLRSRRAPSGASAEVPKEWYGLLAMSHQKPRFSTCA
jgi:hypothetical protein